MSRDLSLHYEIALCVYVYILREFQGLISKKDEMECRLLLIQYYCSAQIGVIYSILHIYIFFLQSFWCI